MSTDNWPAWYFGPRGERRIFEQASDVPEGWADTPAAFPAVAEPATPSTRDDGELARLSDLVAKFQAERDKLVEGLDDLGIKTGGDLPVGTALRALATLKAQLAPLDGDSDGKPGGLRGERKELMEKLKAANIAFKPTLSTAALKELLEGRAE